MMDTFTCKDCGSHDLIVTHDYVQTSHYMRTIACTCGEAEDGIAAQEHYHIIQPYTESGLLDETHHWEYDEHEDADTADTERDEYEVYCGACVESAGALDVEIEPDGEPDLDDHEFFVNCAGCRREIAFAWSHPDRAGRIWPVECADYDPRLGWVEPRYQAD